LALSKDILRDRAVVARQAHNLKVIGSSPVPATKFFQLKAIIIISTLVLIAAFGAFASHHLTKEARKDSKD